MEASPPPRSERALAYNRKSAASEPTPSSTVSAPFQTLSYSPLPHEVKRPHPPAGSQTASRARTSRNANREVVPFALDNVDASTVKAVTSVACAWRGYFVRKALRSQRITELFREKKLVKMQCFLRCWKARKSRERMAAAREEKRLAISARYNEERVQEIGPVVQWQRNLFETAATKVQKVFRWYLARRNGDLDAPFPLEIAKKVYFPNRRALQPREQTPNEPINDTKNVLVVIPTPPEPSGPTEPVQMLGVLPEDEILAANNAMRRREANQEYLKSLRAHRREENINSIVAMDMDACAAIIQRQYKCFAAKNRYSHRKNLQEYLEHKACVVQRAVRSYFSRKWQRELIDAGRAELKKVNRAYMTAQVQRVEAEYAWNRYTMDKAAATIQRGFRYFLHVSAFDPAEHESFDDWKAKGPEVPPYGLLGDTRSPGRREKLRLPKRTKKAQTEEQMQRAKEDDAAIKIQCMMRQQQAKRDVAEKHKKKQKPKEQPIEEPETRPEEKPTEEPETQPEGKPTEEPETQPEEKPTEEPETQPEEKPAEPDEQQMKEDEAAIKIQCMIRQKQARQAVEEKKLEKVKVDAESEEQMQRVKEDDAAIKIQCMMRQKQARADVAEKRKNKLNP